MNNNHSTPTDGRLFSAEWNDRIAVIAEPSGVTLSYAELEAESNRIAHLFRSKGLTRGQAIAIVMDNSIEFLVVAWAAQRTGLYYVGVNTHLTAAEAQYIISDSGSVAVIAGARFVHVVDGMEGPDLFYVMSSPAPSGWETLDASRFPDSPVADGSEGDFMLYSSGTTGRPKGIQRELTAHDLGTYLDRPGQWLSGLLEFRAGDTYLCPAPLYHAAPLGWSMAVNRLGGTVVVMQQFDAAHALELIELHRVTHSQWVPTMFVRMLKLPAEIRSQFDLSSHRVAIHAAAPCPIEVKRHVIDWWGPILFEFYSSTEGMGATAIRSDEWLERPGSVGLPLLGAPIILDDNGNELPPGEIGTVWFSGGVKFRYRGDPGSTAAARDESTSRASVGDVGYLDEDGYLYLAGRRSHLVISGGVNIYPQEIENTLIMHHEVLDVAVIGVPDDEMGESLLAVVQPVDTSIHTDALAATLIEFAREHLAGYKVPRSFRFVDSLPRTPTGKLLTRSIPTV